MIDDERCRRSAGALIRGREMSGLTWLRVGGPADWLFQPADADDLQAFLAALDPGDPGLPDGRGLQPDRARRRHRAAW